MIDALKAKAQAGDRDAAFTLARGFHDYSEIERLADNGDREARQYPAWKFDNWR